MNQPLKSSLSRLSTRPEHDLAATQGVALGVAFQPDTGPYFRFTTIKRSEGADVVIGKASIGAKDGSATQMRITPSFRAKLDKHTSGPVTVNIAGLAERMLDLLIESGEAIIIENR